MCVQHWYLYDLKLKRSWVVKSPCHLWLCVHSIHSCYNIRARHDFAITRCTLIYAHTHTLSHFSSDNHKRTFSLSICYLLRPFKPGMTQPRFDDKQVLEMYAKCVCAWYDCCCCCCCVVCTAVSVYVCVCVSNAYMLSAQIIIAQKPRQMILSYAIWISMQRDCCC